MSYPLPMSVRKAGRRTLRYVDYMANNGETTVTYNGESHTVAYTPQTANKFQTLVKDNTIVEEGVPVDLLDHDAELSIDVGGHVGQYTILLRLLNPETPVKVYEPDSQNRIQLATILGINEIDATICPEVVTGTTGTVSFYVDAHYTESHTTTPTDGFAEVSKPSVALSDVLAHTDSAFCKIDAEGGEDVIVDDLQTIDADLSGLIELHPEKLETPAETVLEGLRQRFNTVRFISESSPNHPEETRIDHEYNRPLYYFA